MFPSPYGDYGSYQIVKDYVLALQGEFPSPYGDYGSYRSGCGRGLEIRHYRVSVPLRGLWFLSVLLVLYIAAFCD